MGRYHTRDRRSGFTLIELLVVISILALLVALAAAGTFKVIESQRVSRTEDALLMLKEALKKQWEKVVTEASKETPSDTVLALAGGDMPRARILWVKMRLTEAFPQKFNEIITCCSTDPKVAKNTIYGWVLDGAGNPIVTQPWIPVDRRKYMVGYAKAIAIAKGTKPETQSAACLYLALTVSRGGYRLGDDQLPSNLSDTDGDGLKELTDNWARPLTFYRFPIYDPSNAANNAATGGNSELASLNPRKAGQPRAKFGDPLDPDGLLQQVVTVGTTTGPWCYSTSGVTFQTLCAHLFPSTPAPLPVNSTAANAQPFWTPYITSSGSDNVLNTTDDLYSFRLRPGARGD